MGILDPTEASPGPSPRPAHWFCGSSSIFCRMHADGFEVPICASSKEGLTRFLLTRNLQEGWMIESTEHLSIRASDMKCPWVCTCEVIQTGCSMIDQRGRARSYLGSSAFKCPSLLKANNMDMFPIHLGRLLYREMYKSGASFETPPQF